MRAFGEPVRLSSTLSIFRARKAWFYKPFTSNARVFQCRVFKRRLKTQSDCGNCKSFIDLARDQNGQSRAKGESGKARYGSIAERAACRIADAQRPSERSRSAVADGHGGIDRQEA